MAIPTLIYSSETWTLTKSQRQEKKNFFTECGGIHIQGLKLETHYYKLIFTVSIIKFKMINLTGFSILKEWRLGTHFKPVNGL
jgi:hypothetical protein